MAALAIDVAREDAGKPVREVFNEGLERLVGMLTTLQPSARDPGACRADTLAQISTMVGALVLARATSGNPISGELMASAREHLLES